MSDTPTRVYYGLRETVIAELGGMTHIYPGKYLVQPDGNATYDAEGADTKEDMMEFVKEMQAQYPEAEFVRL